jgi:hypothetical protein
MSCDIYVDRLRPYEVHTLVKDGDSVMKAFWLRESEQGE